MNARLKSIASWFGRFLELRLRAFVYAMFTVVGFILGVMVHSNMAVAAIDEYREQVKAAVAEAAK